jgi:hypothetical protein
MLLLIASQHSGDVCLVDRLPIVVPGILCNALEAAQRRRLMAWSRPELCHAPPGNHLGLDFLLGQCQIAHLTWTRRVVGGSLLRGDLLCSDSPSVG